MKLNLSDHEVLLVILHMFCYVINCAFNLFRKIVTCGSDGDVRLWATPEDKNPVVFPCSDSAIGIACHKNTLYVGTENNAVESFSLPEGKEEKVVAKFTAAVNHVDVSKSGKILVAGSG